MTGGATLRTLRLRAGHTQAEAAALVHVHTRTWERWEAGSRAVDDRTIHLYALLTQQKRPK